MQKNFNPKEFEKQIYKKWIDSKAFIASEKSTKPSFSMVMPPPNITGQLHMGHALNNTIQDIIARYKRMAGFQVLWVPGTDHASIATEVKIIEKLKSEGLEKKQLGREGFLKEAFLWNDKYGNKIVEQLKEIGTLPDWHKQAFTMDKGCSEAVLEAFTRLYKKGLIYRANRMINYCYCCKTALSDAEVEHKENDGKLWYIKYDKVIVATTRPETMFGDVAVAVNPKDSRYKSLIGKTVKLPLTNKEIPIIADDFVDSKFGTGAVKITPAHDPNDFEVGLRHKLEQVSIFSEDGKMNELAYSFKGLTRLAAREAVAGELEAQGLLVKVEARKNQIGHCYRCSDIVEPKVSLEWFVKMKGLASPALKAVENGDIKFVPSRFSKIYIHWLKNIKDWCISRSLWWGHRIPAYYCTKCSHIKVEKEAPTKCEKCSGEMVQDEAVLDTWFSSALWPFSTMGWPNKTQLLEKFYPTTVLVTGYDIIFFWVARMVFFGLEFMGKKPFSTVYINGLVRDEDGKKMSKSAGNGIDPIDIVEKYGADAFRFSLVEGTTSGGDQRFSEEKIVSAMHFMNKLYNAARFVKLQLDNCAEGERLQPVKLSLCDRWILTKLNATIEKVKKSYDKFEVGHSASTLYEFTRDYFCDWYIELCKVRKNIEVLVFVLDAILKLLHPIIPFITEEIYSGIFPAASAFFSKAANSLLGDIAKETDSLLLLSEFPKKGKSYKAIEKRLENIIDIIRAIRSYKAENKISATEKIELRAVPIFDIRDFSKEENSYIEKLGSVTVLVPQKRTALTAVIEKPPLTEEEKKKADTEFNNTFDTISTSYATIYIKKKIKDEGKIAKERALIEQELSVALAKLSNKGFIEKAPKAVVDKEKERVMVLQQRLSRL